MINVAIEKSWEKVLADQFKKDYFNRLTSFINKEYLTKKICPKSENIFCAFDLCPFEKVSVVILGQDPYHGPNQAHGLSFSVKNGIQKPPSLKNIYKELEDDLQIKMSDSGDLTPWAKQGVFLLNATLTVRAGIAGSHQHKGWEEFTDSVIKILSEKKENLVFLLWGAYAQSKKYLIDNQKHLILTAPHPSPLSVYRGFYGCKHFSKTNQYLENSSKKKIFWKL